MSNRIKVASAMVIAGLLSTPAIAEPHKHHHKGGKGSHASHCPPGLAKKDPACVPPGLAKKHAKRDGHHRHYHRVGDRLNLGDFILIPNPKRYGLEVRDGWNYYRDPYGIYRVDPNTRRVLAVLELIDAFTN